MSATTFDKSKLPSRHTTVGPTSAPHRSMLYAMGLTEQQIAQPLVGVVTTWNEAAPCNITLVAPGAGGEEGRRRRRRHAARVHHHHRHRRHRHGPCRHEDVAGQPRGDRGFGRADGARALLRRAGRPRRLRQDLAGADDGDGAPERAVGLHLRRHDHARQVPRQGRDHRRRVRGRRRQRGQAHERRRPQGARAGGAADRRLVRRPVHGQHDGLRLGGARAGAAEFGGNAGAL